MKKQISPSQTNGTNPKHINWRTWLVATLLAIYPLFLCYQFITGFSTPGGASIIMPADEDGPGYDRFYSETKRLAAACNCPVTFEKKDTAVHFIVWRDSTWFHDPYHLPYDPSTVSYTRYKQALDSMEWLKQRVVRPAQEMQTFAGDYLGIARRANPVSSRPQLKTVVSHPDSQEILYPDTAADAAVRPHDPRTNDSLKNPLFTHLPQAENTYSWHIVLGNIEKDEVYDEHYKQIGATVYQRSLQPDSSIGNRHYFHARTQPAGFIFLPAEKKLLLPISEYRYRLLKALFYVSLFLTGFLWIYGIIYLPLLLMVRLASRKVFDAVNLTTLQRVGAALVAMVLLPQIPALAARFLLRDAIPAGLKLPALYQMLSMNNGLMAGAILAFAFAYAFRKGMQLQEEQQLTI